MEFVTTEVLLHCPLPVVVGTPTKEHPTNAASSGEGEGSAGGEREEDSDREL